MAASLTVRLADYADVRDAAALVMLLDAYASDPAGGGQPLSEYARLNLGREFAVPQRDWPVLCLRIEAAAQRYAGQAVSAVQLRQHLRALRRALPWRLTRLDE